MTSPSLLSFGPFRIDLANETLWRGHIRLPLKPKSFAVLRTLLERPQELVTKEDLLNAHWGDVAVGDAVLKTCISEIRQAIGEQASHPAYIETLHRRGYRFVGTPIPTSETTEQSPAHPFVGREQELATLLGWWESVKQGNQHVIFVTGEPGVGKTSLVDALLAPIQASGEAWIGRGHCIEQYGAGEPYLPILEALGRLCRQPEGEALVTCLRQYAPTWLMHLPGLIAPEEMPPLLSSIIGATPVRMMRELADAIEVFTPEHPIILSLEDLHWLDTSSLELLTYVARRSNAARLMVVGTYRPADLILLKHPLKHTKQELLLHGQCQELRLECLTKSSVEAFLFQRFVSGDETGASLHSLAQVVHRRTEGNPLFMVNLVDYYLAHDLLVQGDYEWTVKDHEARTTTPTGLRQFIDLRVEQLKPDDRHLLAIASIAGMEFSTATIAAGLETTMADLDERCHDLVQREQFIRSHGTSQWPDGTVSARFEFQHALYQETLYEHIPVGQRIEWHRKIGEQLEQGYGERTRDIVAELALHFERGQEPDRASLYHQQAGEEAFKRSAHHETTLHVTKALELLHRLPPGLARDQRELALQSLRGILILQTKGFAKLEAGQALGRAHELCQQFPNNPQFIPSIFGLFRYYVTISNQTKARELREQLACLAQQTGEAEVLLLALTCQGGMAMFWGAPQSALSPLQQAITLEEGIDSVSLLVKYGEETRIISRHFLSWVLWTLGFPDQSKTEALKALSQAHALNNPFMHVLSLLWNAITHMMQRDDPQALCLSQEALALAQKHGYQQWETESLLLRSSIHLIQGAPSEGPMDQERFATLRQLIDMQALLPCTTGFIIESTWQSGQYQEGLTLVQLALDRLEAQGMTWYEAELIRLKGELLLSVGGPDSGQAVEQAETSFQEAMLIARKQGAKSFELRAAMSLCRLWQQQGKGHLARPKLKRIYDWFTEGFDTKDLQEAKALLDAFQ
ncbi:MAG: AAA family ATPase [Nitrospirota bacterium]|nr:AAA family ATPase [Nitrospirota bacterium]